MGCLGYALVSLSVISIPILWEICRVLFWRPYVLTKCFRKQGIRGPPYSLLYGSLYEIQKLKNAARERVLDTNSNDIILRVLPHYHNWSLEYGWFIFLSLFFYKFSLTSITLYICSRTFFFFLSKKKLYCHLLNL